MKQSERNIGNLRISPGILEHGYYCIKVLKNRKKGFAGDFAIFSENMATPPKLFLFNKLMVCVIFVFRSDQLQD